jgi:hypothetical protein
MVIRVHMTDQLFDILFEKSHAVGEFDTIINCIRFIEVGKPQLAPFLQIIKYVLGRTQLVDSLRVFKYSCDYNVHVLKAFLSEHYRHRNVRKSSDFMG